MTEQKLPIFRFSLKWLLPLVCCGLFIACADDSFPDVFREQNEDVVWVSTVNDTLRTDTLSRVSFRYAITRDNFCLTRARWDTLFKSESADTLVLRFVGQYPLVAECQVTTTPDTLVFTLPSTDSGRYSYQFTGADSDTIGWSFILIKP